ncbi:MAG: PEP-CTERM sorting domain-containing protein [Pseudomonadota bacterium]
MSALSTRIAALALPFALLTGLSAQASTNLLQNGSFEASSTASSQDGSYCYNNFPSNVECGTAVPSWTGTFVLIAADSGPWGTPQNLGNNALIDGHVVAGIQGNSSLSQSVSLSAGSYTLSWVDTNRNGYDNQFYDVLLGSVTLGSFSTTVGDAWTTRSLTFTVGTSGLQTLTFAGLERGGIDGTSFIDNVQLTSAVPEPSDLALVLAGLAVVGSVARRRAAR